jgi:hypothetical protein
VISYKLQNVKKKKIMQGIYKLVFKGLEDFPYVGQSLDIDRRYRAHIASLKRGKSNFKLQEAYEMCGEPELVILEETSDLTREVFWIDQLGSIENGLNITKGGDSSGSGYNHARSKYSREQIIQVLEYLTDPAQTNNMIMDSTGVSTATINDIKNGRSHIWLQDEFPDLYTKIANINRYTHDILEPVWVVSPDNKEYEVENSAESIREAIPNADNLLVAGILKVIKGGTYKGWRLKGSDNLLCTLVSPDNTIHKIYKRGISEFARNHGLTKQGLSNLIHHPKKVYKGWKHLIEK